MSKQVSKYYTPNFVPNDINSNEFPKPVKFCTVSSLSGDTKPNQELPNDNSFLESSVSKDTHSNEWFLYRKAKKYYNKIKNYIW